MEDCINYILMLCFFLVPMDVCTNHFHLFITLKEFFFATFVSISLGIFLGTMILYTRLTLRKSRLSLAIAIYYFYNLLSYLAFPYTDQAAFISFTYLILLAFIVSSVTHLQARNNIIYTLTAVAAMTSLYGSFQFFGKDFSWSFPDYFAPVQIGELEGHRIFTTFGHPNIVGGFSVFMIPLLLTFLLENLYAKKYVRSCYIGLTFLLSIFALFLSRTRGSWIASGCSLGILCIVLLKKQGLILVKRSLLVFGGILVVLTFTIWAAFPFLKTHTSIVDTTSWKIRWQYYAETLAMIKEHPFFGRGFGTFNVYYPVYHNKRIGWQIGEPELEYRIEHPHNEHLEILHDGGLIGYGLFLWIIAEAGYRFFKQKTLIAAGLGMSLCGLLCDGILSQNLRFIVISSLFWLLIGFANIPDTHEKQTPSRVIQRINFPQMLGIVSIIIFVGLSVFMAYHRMQADFYVKGGMSHYVSNNFPDAISWFQEAISRNSHNKRAWYYLANSYRSVGDNERALQTYARVLELDPNFLQANYYLGVLYSQKQDVPHARYYFEKQIAAHNMHWKAYYNLAMLCLYQNDREQAWHFYQEVKKIHLIKAIDTKILMQMNQLFAQ